MVKNPNFIIILGPEGAMKSVQVSVYNQVTTKKEVHSIINVESALQQFKQGKHMTNSETV